MQTPRVRSEPPSPNDELVPLLTPEFLRVLAVQVSIGLGYSGYFLLPKFLATEFNAGAGTIGAVTSIALWAGVAASPLVGRALDRCGRRLPVALGGALVALTSLGFLAVHRVGPLLYALRVGQGIGFSLGFSGAAAQASDLSPSSRLGQAMGLLGVASLATSALSPWLGESVASRHGWQPLFVAAALTGALTSLLSLTAVDTRAAPRSAHRTPSAQVKGLGCAAVSTGAAFATLISFTQPFALSLGAQRIAGHLAGYTAGALLSRVGFGSIADRAGRLRVAKSALFAYAAAALVTSSLRVEFLFVFGFLFGVAHGFLYPALAALAAEGSAPERRGRALSAFTAWFNAGAGASLLGFGWLAERQGYPLVFALAGAGTLFSALLLGARRPAPPSAPHALRARLEISRSSISARDESSVPVRDESMTHQGD